MRENKKIEDENLKMEIQKKDTKENGGIKSWRKVALQPWKECENSGL